VALIEAFPERSMQWLFNLCLVFIFSSSSASYAEEGIQKNSDLAVRVNALDDGGLATPAHQSHLVEVTPPSIKILKIDSDNSRKEPIQPSDATTDVVEVEADVVAVDTDSANKKTLPEVKGDERILPAKHGAPDEIYSAKESREIGSSNNEDKPISFWIVSLVIASITLVVSLFNTWRMYQNFAYQNRKSIYDDFWFRDIFFKTLNTEIIKFRSKWSRVKLRESVDEEGSKLLDEYFSDLASLRDIASVIRIVKTNAAIGFEDAFEMLENLPQDQDPEYQYGLFMSTIHQLSFQIHKSLENAKYNVE